MAKRRRKNYVTADGINVIEKELNKLEKEIQDSKNMRQKSRERSLEYIKDGMKAITEKLKIHCICALPPSHVSWAGRKCVCQRSLRDALLKARIQFGKVPTMSLSGDCRDEEGKFVPVRNCTGRGTATKRKTKKKAKGK
jgi:hypothetical protein